LVHAGARSRNQLNEGSIHPPRALGVIIGGVISAWAFGLAIGAAIAAVGGTVEFKTFLAWVICGVLAVLGALFAYWAWALFTLSYTIGREHLTIRWGLRRIDIPIGNIQRMIPGRTVYDANVQGLNWWGCHVGHADVTRVGYTLFYSTHSSPDELLYVVTSGEAFGLTVLDQAAFAEEVQANAALGPSIGELQRAASSGLAAFPIWRDNTSKTLAFLSLLAALVVCGFVYGQYPGLPAVVELKYPAIEGIVRVGEKSELLRIAYVSAAVAIGNAVLGTLVHARLRSAGLWLFASGGMVQMVLLASAIVAFSAA
jgi:hypothetical protein